jgi:flavodoxin
VRLEDDAMEQRKILTRREALKNACALAAATNLVLSTDSAEAQPAPGNAKTLVAYFTRTGNTRVIAHQLRRALRADLFEIRPAEPYPEDYEETVRQAEGEGVAGYEPPLEETPPSLDAYATVFLGFPIWGMTAPAVIRSFLSHHDLSGKTIVPFITHGGYGLGQSLAVIAAHAPQARLVEGFSLQADQERETLSQVTRWLGRLNSGD